MITFNKCYCVYLGYYCFPEVIIVLLLQLVLVMTQCLNSLQKQVFHCDSGLKRSS